MGKNARRFCKNKKGFTLVEIIVVVAIMVLAAAVVIPNLSGATTRAEKDTYRSYCLQAKEDMKIFCNLLNSGETSYHITAANYEVTTLDISTPEGLMQAMNAENRQSKFQYYIIGFTKSDAQTDPTKSITSADLTNDVDIIVPVFYYNSTKKTYEIRGAWYYSVGKARVVLTFDKSNNDYDGCVSLYSDKN